MKIPLFIGEYHSVHVGAKAGEWVKRIHLGLNSIFSSKEKDSISNSNCLCSFHQYDLLNLLKLDAMLCNSVRMIYPFWWRMPSQQRIPSSLATTFLSLDTRGDYGRLS